jgi:hypothetical protein
VIPSAVKVIVPLLAIPLFAKKVTLKEPLFFPDAPIGMSQFALDETFQTRFEDTVAVNEPPVAGKVLEVGDTII